MRIRQSDINPSMWFIMGVHKGEDVITFTCFGREKAKTEMQRRKFQNSKLKEKK